MHIVAVVTSGKSIEGTHSPRILSAANVLHFHSMFEIFVHRYSEGATPRQFPLLCMGCVLRFWGFSVACCGNVECVSEGSNGLKQFFSMIAIHVVCRIPRIHTNHCTGSIQGTVGATVTLSNANSSLFIQDITAQAEQLKIQCCCSFVLSNIYRMPAVLVLLLIWDYISMMCL